MYEVLGALAFAVLAASYVLAVLFIQHPSDRGFSAHRSTQPQGKK